MKSRLKFENDFHEYSKTERVILVVILVLVTLVVISWASQGFAFNDPSTTVYDGGLGQLVGHNTSVMVDSFHSEDERGTT